MSAKSVLHEMWRDSTNPDVWWVILFALIAMIPFLLIIGCVIFVGFRWCVL